MAAGDGRRPAGSTSSRNPAGCCCRRRTSSRASRSTPQPRWRTSPGRWRCSPKRRRSTCDTCAARGPACDVHRRPPPGRRLGPGCPGLLLAGRPGRCRDQDGAGDGRGGGRDRRRVAVAGGAGRLGVTAKSCRRDASDDADHQRGRRHRRATAPSITAGKGIEVTGCGHLEKYVSAGSLAQIPHARRAATIISSEANNTLTVRRSSGRRTGHRSPW